MVPARVLSGNVPGADGHGAEIGVRLAKGLLVIGTGGLTDGAVGECGERRDRV